MSGRRLKLTIAAALVALTAPAFAGYGGDDDAADAGGSTAATASPRATAPPFDAEDAVIALSDLPSGWAVSPDTGVESAEFCGQDESDDDLISAEAVDEAETQFAEGGDIPGLVNEVGVYAPGEADAEFDKYRELVTDCSSIEIDGTTYDAAPVSFPEVGDESVALLVSRDIRGSTVGFFYFVFARVADGITIVGYGDLEPDVAEVEKYVRLAVAKLGQAQGISS